MESTKKVPTRRFKGFTDVWEQRKLEDGVTKVGDGLHGTPKYVQDGGVYFLNGNNIMNGKIKITNETKRVTKNEQSKNDKTLNDNTILMSINGTIGSLAFYNGESVMLGKSVAYIIVSAYNKFFVYYFLQTNNTLKYFLNHLTGTTIKNLGLKTIRETPIKISPNIQEQAKIGKFFKQLDDTIALHQRKLNKLKNMKQAYLQEMFPAEGETKPKRRFEGFTDDWEQRKLIDFISGDISDGDWIEKEHIKDEGEYRIIQTGNIGNGDYIDKANNAKYMNQDSFDILKANEIFPGDLLISRLADPAGRTIILPNIGDRMVTAVDVTVLRQNENFDAYFFLSQMNKSNLLNKVSKYVSGTSHKRISRKNLEKIVLNSTSIKEQQKIGAFFKSLDDTIALQEQKLTKLQQLKSAYLEEMFV